MGPGPEMDLSVQNCGQILVVIFHLLHMSSSQFGMIDIADSQLIDSYHAIYIWTPYKKCYKFMGHFFDIMGLHVYSLSAHVS